VSITLLNASDDLSLLDDISKAHVVIDFSSAAGLLKLLQTAVQHGTAVVSGSTGLQASHHQALEQAATHIPLLWAANMSPGMNLLYQLAADAATHLGVDADVEISEAHHRDKRDVPSGSALTLANNIAVSRGQSLDEVMIQRETGGDAMRQSGEIGISSTRGGSMPGEHTVLFALQHECLLLSHRVENLPNFVQELPLRRMMPQCGIPNLRQRVSKILGETIVSHATNRGLNGAFHEETGYGLRKVAGETAVVYRIPLDQSFSKSKVPKVVDPVLREQLAAFFENGGAITQETPFRFQKRQGSEAVRHVRVVAAKRYNPEAHLEILDESGLPVAVATS